MRRGYRVEIAREVQIYILHGHDLSVTAASRAAFYPKTRSETRFAQRHANFFTEPSKSVRQTDRSRSFALAGGSWSYRRDQNQFAVGIFFYAAPHVSGDFRFELPVKFQIVFRQSEFFRRHRNFFNLRALRNFNVAQQNNHSPKNFLHDNKKIRRRKIAT